MWRRIASKAHPDAGGDGELFVWISAVKEAVCSGQPRKHAEAPTREEPRRKDAGHRNADDAPDRVPFDAEESFDQLTSLVLERAGMVADVFGELLLLLGDCRPMADMERQQRRGASYRQLAYVAHLANMSKRERVGWYRLAEDVSLADRHVSHLISRLKKSEAA
jgi:hypothetical protein